MFSNYNADLGESGVLGSGRHLTVIGLKNKPGPGPGDTPEDETTKKRVDDGGMVDDLFFVCVPHSAQCLACTRQTSSAPVLWVKTPMMWHVQRKHAARFVSMCLGHPMHEERGGGTPQREVEDIIGALFGFKSSTATENMCGLSDRLTRLIHEMGTEVQDRLAGCTTRDGLQNGRAAEIQS